MPLRCLTICLRQHPISIHTTAEFAFDCSVMTLNATGYSDAPVDATVCEYEYALDDYGVWGPTQPEMVLYHLYQGDHLIQLRSR